MFFLLIKFYTLVKLRKYAVNTCADKTRGAGVIKYFLMLAFFTADNRRQNLQLCAFVPAHNCVDNLVNRLFLNNASADRTMRYTYTGIQKPVIVVNFCNRPDRGTRIIIRRFLFNRNSRRQAL